MRRDKFPSELSGGMIKRAALARALALDPDIVFLDEPTSGLDPIGAAEFDELVAKLRDTMGLTVYMVTHDLDSLFSVCDRIAVLGNKKVLVEGTIEDMLASEEPWVKSYFRGKRARQLDLAARAVAIRAAMETRANYVIVGIFTLVAILAAFAFVYWTAAIGDRGETATLRVRIPGSASGLGRGSAVLFNGVKVGDVRRVYIDVDNPTVAIADTEIDRLTPITKSTQADIGLAGLTGQANIELKGADLKEPNLLDEAEARRHGRRDHRQSVGGDQSAADGAGHLQARRQCAFRARRLHPGRARTADRRRSRTPQKFSDALAENSDGIDKFLASVSRAVGRIGGRSGKLDGTLKAAEELLNSVDRDKIETSSPMSTPSPPT